MSEKIVQLNEEVIKGQIRELVRGSVEETLNELLEKEAESLTHPPPAPSPAAATRWDTPPISSTIIASSFPIPPNYRFRPADVVTKYKKTPSGHGFPCLKASFIYNMPVFGQQKSAES